MDTTPFRPSQLAPIEVPFKVLELIDAGALFVANHSGGKDSQLMYEYLCRLVPRSQLVLVHADLGDEVEWEGAVDHIRATTAGERLETCRSRRRLIQMIEERGKFPSPQQRQCTSDLKRGPIERTIRQLVRERQAQGLGAKALLVVNCMGMRAEESPGRSKLTPFKRNAGNSKAGRDWYDWLPIHSLTTEQVFAGIAASGKKPHWVYEAGMTRFSCRFCIMSSVADLRTAARLAPQHYRTYVGLERSTGQVMMMPSKTKGRQTLEQITGIYIDEPASVEPSAPASPCASRAQRAAAPAAAAQVEMFA